MKYVLGLDPGTRAMGISLVKQTGKGKKSKIELMGVTTVKRVDHTEEGVNVGMKEVDSFLRTHKVKWGDVEMIIECPAPRWYGRNNSVALIKIFWQVLYICKYFQRKVGNIVLIDSFDWNRKRMPGDNGTFYYSQYGDKEKKERFLKLFPGISKGNTDTRDATLMCIKHIEGYE